MNQKLDQQGKKKIELHQYKSFCVADDTETLRWQPTEWKYLQIMYLIRDLYPEYIKNSYNSMKGKIAQFKKWVKDLNIYFSKEDIKITIKHVKDAQYH